MEPGGRSGLHVRVAFGAMTGSNMALHSPSS
jgi:hypothetical protein